MRALLSARQFVVGEIRKVGNHLRGTLKSFGLRTGKTSRRSFENRIRKLVAGGPARVEIVPFFRRWYIFTSPLTAGRRSQ